MRFKISVRICSFRVFPESSNCYGKVCYTNWGTVNIFMLPLRRYHSCLADIWRSREINFFTPTRWSIKNSRHVKSQPFTHCYLHDFSIFKSKSQTRMLKYQFRSCRISLLTRRMSSDSRFDERRALHLKNCIASKNFCPPRTKLWIFWPEESQAWLEEGRLQLLQPSHRDSHVFLLHSCAPS